MKICKRGAELPTIYVMMSTSAVTLIRIFILQYIKSCLLKTKFILPTVPVHWLERIRICNTGQNHLTVCLPLGLWSAQPT